MTILENPRRISNRLLASEAGKLANELVAISICSRRGTSGPATFPRLPRAVTKVPRGSVCSGEKKDSRLPGWRGAHQGPDRLLQGNCEK